MRISTPATHVSRAGSRIHAASEDSSSHFQRDYFKISTGTNAGVPGAAYFSAVGIVAATELMFRTIRARDLEIQQKV